MPKGADSDRDLLIEKHRSYAHALAARTARSLPRIVDVADLRGAAELGLVDAARGFEPSRNVRFTTFAYYRILGSIYDHLRISGWFSRTELQRVRFAQAANEN